MANEHTCGVCGQDPMKSDGCRVAVIYIENEKYTRIPFFGNAGERCHDCNALSGHYHHWGCDAEVCPMCGGQLIGCECEEVECPVIVNSPQILSINLFFHLRKQGFLDSLSHL